MATPWMMGQEIGKRIGSPWKDQATCNRRTASGGSCRRLISPRNAVSASVPRRDGEVETANRAEEAVAANFAAEQIGASGVRRRDAQCLGPEADRHLRPAGSGDGAQAFTPIAVSTTSGARSTPSTRLAVPTKPATKREVGRS